jgi:choline dehydrogenase-like flavoprotein
MQIDLNHFEAAPSEAALPKSGEPGLARGAVHSQVCIVGGGIAGITLAHRLHQLKIDVVLLEAGGHGIDPAGQSLLEAAQFSGQPHAGTHEGRFRAFGGCSLRWGGQLLPLPRRHSWPIASEDLALYDVQAQALLGVDELPYEGSEFFAATFNSAPTLVAQLPELDARISKFAPFGRRNMANSPGRELLESKTTRVFLNAQVSELLLAPDGSHLEAVLVRDRRGKTLRFTARHFVLAAGAIETARLLLASRSIAAEGVANRHDQVGRNFHDHLSLPAARLTGPARKLLLRQLRPWIFDTSRFGPTVFGPSPFGATVHSAKLEASAALCAQLDINPCLAHITLVEPPDSGFAVVRKLLTARQHGGLAGVLPAAARHLPRAVIDALRLAWSSGVHNRRYVSPSTFVNLQLNTAQDAPSASRITLSDQLDPFGLPLPVLDWRISARELNTLRRFAAHLQARFEGIAGFDWAPELFEPEGPLPKLGDARHAMGGAIMGVDPRTSVVDTNLTVHDLPNLHIASGAVFPTGAPQLITLPLMSLALRLGDRLNVLLRR